MCLAFHAVQHGTYSPGLVSLIVVCMSRLFCSYEDKYYYWESVIMLRKFVLVVVVIFLVNEGTDMQLLVTLAVIIAAMVAHMTVEPFRWVEDIDPHTLQAKHKQGITNMHAMLRGDIAPTPCTRAHVVWPLLAHTQDATSGCP